MRQGRNASISDDVIYKLFKVCAYSSLFRVEHRPDEVAYLQELSHFMFRGTRINDLIRGENTQAMNIE